jgi:hypothetical protein
MRVGPPSTHRPNLNLAPKSRKTLREFAKNIQGKKIKKFAPIFANMKHFTI